MRASLNVIRQIGATETDLLQVGLDELVRLATNRLGGLEGYQEYGKRFDGIVVAKVVSCVAHENSDHLHVCLVDDGRVVEDVERTKEGFVQVVCGAPNVREGLIVAWIPPGAIVPSSRDESEPFVLGEREIRGVMSNGMLASPSELGLFDNHDGILEIDVSEVGEELVVPGTEFKKLYGLDDVLLDFENKMFTHRPDCFGQIGLGRELAAIQGLQFTTPQWYWKKPWQDKGVPADPSTNEVPELVPRLMTAVMSNVTVADSPVWLKSFITRMGGKPVNNVVDISNYIMHLTGQPTHAYDLRKLSGEQIIARMAKDGETINLLNGKNISLTSEDIVIADKKGPVGVAGIMGGKDTEVDKSTTDILLEVASFDMYAIRRTAMRHGLFTDALTRFSKGQSVLQNDRVIAKFMEVLSEITGATQNGDVKDITSEFTEQRLDLHAMHPLVKVSVGFINSRLGTNLSFDDINKILKYAEMAVIRGEDGSDEFEVGAPYWRTDIELPEDVVEEVGRLYGFDRLKLKLPARSAKPAPKNDLQEFKSTIRKSLAAAGANETLTYSFIHGDVLKKSGIADPDQWCYHLRNAISPDLQYYRPMLISSLITKVHSNLKSDMVRGDDNEFGLYEIGKVHVRGHNDDEDLPTEMERLAFVFAADDKTANKKYHGSALYMAKQYLLPFMNGQLEFRPLESNDYPITAVYEKKRSATIYVNGELLGVVGEFRQSVKTAFKLPDYSAGYELDLQLLIKHMSSTRYQKIGSYPKSQQDITLAIPVTTPFQDVAHVIEECLRSIAGKDYQYTYVPRDLYKKDDQDTNNITFRIWLWHLHKTLKTEEVNLILDELAKVAKTRLNAERI